MRKHKSVYMEYMRLHGGLAKLHIGASGVEPMVRKQLGMKLDELEIFGSYKNGYNEHRLHEAVSSYYDIPKPNIMLSIGSSTANFLVCGLFLDRGKEVIVEDPVYEPLLQCVNIFRPRVKRLPRLFKEGYQINLNKLKNMVSKKTKLIVLTNLHNPSGVWIEPEQMKAIGDIAGNVGAYVLADEVYLDFVRFGDRKGDFKPSFTVHPRIITTASLTKVYGLAGLRFGWAFASEDIIYWMQKFHDCTSVVGSYPAEMVALAAFKRMKKLHVYVNKIIGPNFNTVKKWIGGRDDIDWVEPHWGSLCFPRLKSRKLTGLKLADYMLQKYDTFITAGEFFDQPKHVRLGMGMKPATLNEGLKYLSQSLDELG